MIDFDELNKNDLGYNGVPTYEKGFEAGQQSQQAKIDELQKKYDAMYNAFVVADDCRKEWHRCYIGVRQHEDELQSRVDEIASHIDINFDEDRDDDQHSYWSGYNQAMRELNDILKGNKYEN